MPILLGQHVVEVDGRVLLELEAVAAAAPLVPAGDQPHPLDGRVTLLARAADHSVPLKSVLLMVHRKKGSVFFL